MTLALFDLDNTLLDGDSDQLWASYLGEKGLLDLKLHGPRIARYHEQYLAGELKVLEYLEFSLSLLREVPEARLRILRSAFVGKMICPRIGQSARKLVESHRSQGHTLIMITLTNRFISGPIAEQFAIENLLATEPEIVDGFFSGRILGQPCYQQGKIAHLRKWMIANNDSLAGSFFYSDSINDLPLLEAVEHPIVVNPDQALADIARQRGWRIRHLAADEGTIAP